VQVRSSISAGSARFRDEAGWGAIRTRQRSRIYVRDSLLFSIWRYAKRGCGPGYPLHDRILTGFSSAFHKESLPSTVSAQRRAGFRLLPRERRRKVSDIQARCSACPARALRQSRRFLVVLEGELPGGFLQKAFRRTGCPGVAASSQSPPHTAGLAVGHRGAAD